MRGWDEAGKHPAIVRSFYAQLVAFSASYDIVQRLVTPTVCSRLVFKRETELAALSIRRVKHGSSAVLAMYVPSEHIGIERSKSRDEDKLVDHFTIAVVSLKVYRDSAGERTGVRWNLRARCCTTKRLLLIVPKMTVSERSRRELSLQIVMRSVCKFRSHTCLCVRPHLHGSVVKLARKQNEW